MVYRFQQQHGRILVFRDGGLNVLRRRGILATLLAFFTNCSTSLLVNSVECRRHVRAPIARTAHRGSRLKRHQSFVSKYERGERRLDVEFLEVTKALRTDPLRLIEAIRD